MKCTSLKEMKILTVINDGGRATFATIVAKVEQKMLKRGNPLRESKIEKRVSYKLSLNCVYQNAVNNQREREGLEKDFVASSNWHEPVFDGVNGSIVRHKTNDKRYLKGIVKSADVLDYFVDGERATPEQIEIIKQFRQVSAPPQNQGVEESIIVRTIAIENIEEVATNGESVTF